MKIKQYDTVRLKSGEEGCAVEVYGDQAEFSVDIGDSPSTWENIDVPRDQIVAVQDANGVWHDVSV